MLTGTLFLIAIAAAVLVILWSIANDGVADDGETGGLFKTRATPERAPRDRVRPGR